MVIDGPKRAFFVSSTLLGLMRGVRVGVKGYTSTWRWRWWGGRKDINFARVDGCGKKGGMGEEHLEYQYLVVFIRDWSRILNHMFLLEMRVSRRRAP